MSVEELSAELELERDDLAEECETRAACERKVRFIYFELRIVQKLRTYTVGDKSLKFINLQRK